MKFTLDWLKEHLETNATTDEISKALTMVGLEVEGVEEQGARLKKFVVAKVAHAEPHPNSDHLNICKVDAGTGELIDVVCGAPNVKTGMKSVFAFPGTYIPGKDFELKAGVVIRGAASNGMLCSAAELELSNDHDGIIALPDDAPIGVPYVDYAGINGVVFDISITPNRGDATGVYGVARDLAAFGLGTLKTTDMAPIASKGPTPIPALPQQFGADEPKAIRKFAGRYIRGVKNGPSPDWLQQRLRAVGLRPINAIVDITNLVSLGWGRPLHAYDADKVVGQMVLRNARNESFDALDNKVYVLDDTMTVIADDQGPLCLGGIMGGIRSGTTDATVNLFMECASWDPDLIARTGRKTGIVSDARYRLERSVDPALTEPGLELATRLVLELCGGEPLERSISGEDVFPHAVVDFPLSEVERLTGLRTPAPEVERILGKLGFELSGSGDTRKVKVPSWRPDVTQKADLAEEVMRMVGVDKVPVDPLPRLNHVAQRMLTPIQNRRRLARRALAARGLDEAVTWSFISDAEAERFGGGQPELKLANPIASELTSMRPSLLPGLLGAARRNGNRGFDDLKLFEVGQIFLSHLPDGQHTYASGIRTGTASLGGAGRHWESKAKPVSVYDAKADLAALLDALGIDIDKVQLVAEPASWSHPGRGGRIQLGPKVIIGWFGEVHPALLADLDLDGPIAAFEVDLDAIPEPRKKPTKAKPALALSDLMPLSRDFAFVVDRSVSAATILKAARGADKALITGVDVFDVFEGVGVGEGKKSVAIEVTLQPQDKTLTDEEIERISTAIVAAVTKATGGGVAHVTGLPVIASFWHGPFGWLEQLSVRSFLRNGHPVHVYGYEPIDGLPEGAEFRDLGELIPRERMFYYKGKGTVGVFSDLVRMTLLRNQRGIWADCDVYSVRPIPQPRDYLMAYERPGSVNGAVLHIPHDAPLLDDLIGIFEDGERPLLEPHLPLARRLEVAAKRLAGIKVPAEYMQYGATGPHALTHYVRKHDLLGKVLPSEVLYPVPYEGIPALMKAGSSLNSAITERTLCVHLWTSQLTRRGREAMPVPEPDSALAALCAAEGVTFSR